MANIKLVVNGLDITNLLAEYSATQEVILANTSGRNAEYNNRVDILNRKYKIKCKLRRMTGDEMSSFLSAIYPYVFNATFFEPKTNTFKTISVYSGIPEPSILRDNGEEVVYDELSINFIEN